jgi:hypothetical protein
MPPEDRPRDDQMFEKEEYELAQCDGSFQHDWDAGSGFGVIIGLSKCKKCGRTSQCSDFEKTRGSSI